MDQLGLHAAALAARSERHVPYAGCLAFSALPWSPVMEVTSSRWARWFARAGRVARVRPRGGAGTVTPVHRNHPTLRRDDGRRGMTPA